MPLRTPRLRRPHTFVPACEALEDRDVPAVLNPVVLGPGVILFNTTAPASGGSNTLNIRDNGFGVLTFNTSSTAGAAFQALPRNAGPVHRIFYKASTGKDTVTYLTTNPLQVPIEFDVFLPSNTTGTGESFTANLGTAAAPGGLPAEQDMNIAKHGKFSLDIFGGMNAKNNITVTSFGQIKGTLNVNEFDPQQGIHGLNGDTTTIRLTANNGSSGTVHPRVMAGVGDDTITVFVYKKNPHDNTRIIGREQVNGGDGMNSIVTGLPITALNG